MSKLIINANRPKAVINRNIYGHFSEHLGRCIYNGLYVGENSPIPNVNGMRSDVVAALKNINVPVLRWPGGCFADEYHWKDGVGDKSKRKKMINTHWGGTVEDNSFGTHEFMELCRQLGCEPYINGNVGSGTVAEMNEWVEYMTFDGVSPMADWRRENGGADPWRIQFFGVGNENWGCGGNMTAEHYADVYRNYQTYVRNYGDNKIFRIACGANADDYHWTQTLIERAGRYMDGLSLHYYTVCGDWEHKGSATDFTDEEYYKTLNKALYMDELIENHSRIMRRYDKTGRVGLVVDEWGTWYDVEPGTNPGFLYQQNTMRDALVAAVTLNIFNEHADSVVMANLAQTVNVLQAVILTEGDKMIITPTHHVFDLYKRHQGATSVESYVETSAIGGEHKLPKLHCSASIDGEALTVTLANLSANDSFDIDGILAGFRAKEVSARFISGKPADYNDFGKAAAVAVKPCESIKREGEGFRLTIPACSVMEITASRGV